MSVWRTAPWATKNGSVASRTPATAATARPAHRATRNTSTPRASDVARAMTTWARSSAAASLGNSVPSSPSDQKACATEPTHMVVTPGMVASGSGLIEGVVADADAKSPDVTPS